VFLYYHAVFAEVFFPLGLQTNIFLCISYHTEANWKSLVGLFGTEEGLCFLKIWGIKIYQSAWCDIPAILSNTAVRTSDLIKDTSSVFGCQKLSVN